MWEASLMKGSVCWYLWVLRSLRCTTFELGKSRCSDFGVWPIPHVWCWERSRGCVVWIWIWQKPQQPFLDCNLLSDAGNRWNSISIARYCYAFISVLGKAILTPPFEQPPNIEDLFCSSTICCDSGHYFSMSRVYPYVTCHMYACRQYTNVYLDLHTPPGLMKHMSIMSTYPAEKD